MTGANAVTYLHAKRSGRFTTLRSRLPFSRTMLAGTPGVRMSLDPKTNDLLVLGDAAVHDKVAEVLKVLDSQEKPGN